MPNARRNPIATATATWYHWSACFSDAAPAPLGDGVVPLPVPLPVAVVTAMVVVVDVVVSTTVVDTFVEFADVPLLDEFVVVVGGGAVVVVVVVVCESTALNVKLINTNRREMKIYSTRKLLWLLRFIFFWDFLLFSYGKKHFWGTLNREYLNHNTKPEFCILQTETVREIQNIKHTVKK